MKKIVWKTALTLTLLGSVPVTSVFAQNNKTAPAAEAVKDVLPKVAAPAQMEALKQQFSRLIVVRDPVTGEFRAADPGELAALTANGSAAARATAPSAGRLPDGAWYLPADLTKIPFLTVFRKADGTVTYQCGKGGRDEK